jgi:hypothetical protein
MAPRITTHLRRGRGLRLHPVVRTVSGHWLLVLASHVIAVAILLVVDQVLHPAAWCGR